jgi:heme/copper-type cytochrome/quinol oxidase subunit 4
MMENLLSAYGISGIAFVGIIIFLLYMKMMKWIFKIVILGAVVLGAYWYFKTSVGS